MVYSVATKSLRPSPGEWKRISRTRGITVWLDGVEVTKRCFYADPRRGVVRLYLLDADGHKYIDRAAGGAAKEERRGRVEVRPK